VTDLVDYDEFGLPGENAARHRPSAAEVVHVEEAGHSLQGDTPLELATIIERFVYG